MSTSTLPPPQVVESRVELELSGFLSGCRTRFLRACAEGPVALAAIPRLAAIDPVELDDAARIDLIQAWERVRAQVDGQQQRALGSVIEATEAAGLDGDAARHEVGAALRLSPITAYDRTRVAATLQSRLPATLAALMAGDISYWQAKTLSDAVDTLPDLDVDALAKLEATVLKVAPDQTVADTRRTVARAIISADPAGAEQRHKKAAKGRRIQRQILPDAMSEWWITMPAPDSAAAWAELTRRAAATQQELRAGAGDDPGLDALRVDTLLDTLLGPGAARHDRATGAAAATVTGAAGTTATGAAGTATGAAGGAAAATGTPTGPTRKRPVPRCRCGGAQTAAVVIDLPTLLGLASNPGELPGYGPIPAGLARELAAERDWIRWTIDPGTRGLLDRGARRYRPSGRLKAFIAAAEPHCRFPGCRRPADACDTDHQINFRSGGRTIVINLGPLCRQHHNAKTHGRWRLHYDPHDGTVTWTSPLGRTYTTSTDPPLL